MGETRYGIGSSYPKLRCTCFRQRFLSIQYLEGEEKEEFSGVGRFQAKEGDRAFIQETCNEIDTVL